MPPPRRFRGRTAIHTGAFASATAAHTIPLRSQLPMSSTALPRLPLVALMAAALVSGCARAQSTDTPAAAAPAPAAADHAVAEKPAPEKADAATPADTAKGEGKPAEKPAEKPLSSEDQAKAETRKKIDRMTLEKMRIDTTLEIAALEARRARDAEVAERTGIEARNALENARLAAATAAVDEAKAENERAIAIANAKAQVEQVRVANEARVIETETKLAKAELDLDLAKQGAAAAKRKRDQESEKILNLRQAYPAEPFVNGVLRISDRRIDFSGPVTDASAAALIDRLHFFNKRDNKAPVFIVIDNSPGGSVLAGYQVLKAMQSSQAPVHVLVKGSAASMAAVITTLAPHSYCYENSVILHHQASAGMRGNLTDMADALRQTNEIYRRINGPVADKMGISLPEFVKRMYADNARGDWSAFGTEAQQLKWVDHIVTAVVDESIDALADDPGPASMRALMRGQTGLVQRTDKDGKTYFELPPLAPGDAWMMAGSGQLYRPAR